MFAIYLPIPGERNKTTPHPCTLPQTTCLFQLERRRGVDLVQYGLIPWRPERYGIFLSLPARLLLAANVECKLQFTDRQQGGHS